MKLSEALSLVQKAPADAQLFPVLLACGFTPLHLENYLAAHLQTVLPNRKVRIATGLYDDLVGTLEQFDPAGAEAAAVVIEWSDLDPRLGYRKLGGWGHRVAANILETIGSRLGAARGGDFENSRCRPKWLSFCRLFRSLLDFTLPAGRRAATKSRCGH